MIFNGHTYTSKDGGHSFRFINGFPNSSEANSFRFNGGLHYPGLSRGSSFYGTTIGPTVDRSRVFLRGGAVTYIGVAKGSPLRRKGFVSMVGYGNQKDDNDLPGELYIQVTRLIDSTKNHEQLTVGDRVTLYLQS